MRFVYIVWGQNEYDINDVIEISSNELLVFGPRAAGNKYLFPLCERCDKRLFFGRATNVADPVETSGTYDRYIVDAYTGE